MSAEEKFGVDVNMDGHELKNSSFEKLPSPPTPFLGRNYFDTTLKVNREWDGTQWVSGGSGGGGGSTDIDFVATADILQYQPVTSNGKVADSNNIAHQGKLIGLSTTDVANTFGGKATGVGEIQNALWSWVIGDLIFLNGTSLSRTPPTPDTSLYSQIIGVAVKTDTIDIDIKQSFGF